MLTAAKFPNDIDALKALLLARDEQILGLQARLNTREAEIEHLKLWIAKLRRMQFGRKSEKLDHQIEQLELQLEDLQADDAEAEREMPPADRAPRQRAPRKALPEHLPRDEKGFCRIRERRRVNRVNCGARTQDESICSTSKGCVFLST